MNSQTKPVINVGPASAAGKTTIPELISTLRSSFRSAEFDRVQQLLMSREEDLKSSLRDTSVHVDSWKRGYYLMEKRYEELASAKLEIEEEVKKYRQECDELREEVTRLKKDQRVSRAREKRAAEERHAKLLKESTKTENDGKKMVLELNEKIVELKSAKSRAEAETEAWKKKFGELEVRVARLEEDAATLMSRDPLLRQKIEEDLGAERLVSDEIVGASIGKDNLGQLQTKETLPPGAGSASNSPVIGSNDSQDADLHTINMVHNSREPVKMKLVFEMGSSNKMVGSSKTGSGRPSKDIIEIDDSDDEIPIVGGKAYASNATASEVILSKNEMTSHKFAEHAYFGQRVEENGRSSTKNSLLSSMPKRKRASSCNTSESENNDDDNFPIRRHKRKQLQGLVHESRASFVDSCFAIPDDGVVKVSPSSDNPVFIRQCEEKAEAKYNSQMPLNYSDSDSDTDSQMDNMIANLRRTMNNTAWPYREDMLQAFERDPELCMNAVCALYRQQTSKEKSVRDSFFSKSQVFDQFDARRGTTLAKFLIDGDPQGQLRKSVSELQQYDPNGLEDCKKLAIRYSLQLFEIYHKKEDPFFLPS